MKANTKVWDWRSYIIHYAPESPTYRHVLLTLSCFMDSAGGSCFPSIEKLIECTALSKPSVIKYLNKAEADGWIEKSIHGFSGQGWKRHEYTASIPEKVVNEINHVGCKGGKPHFKGGKSDSEKVVKEVNSNSPYNSLNNSPDKARPSDFTRLNEVPIPEEFQSESLFEAYQKFMEYMIEEKGIKVTPIKTELHVAKLMRLFQQGNDPVKVIEQTIMGDNKVFFALRENQFSTKEFEPELIDEGTF